MSASGRVLAAIAAGRTSDGRAPRAVRVLGASGQLGYGIPTPAFEAGLARRPDMIGCDMGSTDIGPSYLGRGEMATAPEATRRDLRKVLLGARRLDVPLVIGSAGSAGAHPHLEATLAMVREIARAERLRFRLGVLRADIPKPLLRRALAAGEVRGFDGSPPLAAEEIEAASHVVAQMGTSAIARALAADVDVVIAGRACDTAIFAALPVMAGFPAGLAMHMAKIVECASLCCVPGGRDAILATLDHDGFELESMAPQRSATPVSVAAHSLYEQGDPFTVAEPEGRLDLSEARYAAIDARRTRVSGARWQAATETWVKLEGARLVGERAVLLAGSADPRFIARIETTMAEVAEVVRELVCENAPQDYALFWRIYGRDGVRAAVPAGEPAPGEIFVLGECIAPSRERAAEVVRTLKQYLLHHGYPGRQSTAGNLAFPFTPPEVSIGPAYRFNIYHLMRARELDALFPLEVENL